MKNKGILKKKLVFILFYVLHALTLPPKEERD